MARKTKAEAEQTRLQIIDAARRTFLEKGVNCSSMEQIAAAAGVTRGAIYWHFNDKVDLFFAMRNQVNLPLLDSLDESRLLGLHPGDPLACIEEAIVHTLEVMRDDAAVRETHIILGYKCEYVGEFERVVRDLQATGRTLMESITAAYRQAHELQQVPPELSPEALTYDTRMFITGLLYNYEANWDTPGHHENAVQAVKNHFALKRRSPSKPRRR